jgi:hypothetical protein
MRAQAVELDEAAAVEQNVEPFARQKLSLLVLSLRPFGAAARFRFLIEFAEFV